MTRPADREASAGEPVETNIAVEQLRLLYVNAGTATVPTYLLALLLVWTLTRADNQIGMWVWCAAVLISKSWAVMHARRQLQKEIDPATLKRQVWLLTFTNALDGAIWGSLAWVALDTATTAGNVLIMAVMAGVIGSAMALLSSVRQVFIGFCMACMLAVVSKLWLVGDPAYGALGVAALLYVLSLLMQSGIVARSSRAAIELRFANLDLIAKLGVEIENANAAQREAAEANMAKSKFLAAASHDLRQPVHALGLFLEVLGRGPLSTAQREVLGSARKASGASAEMLNTLLDFSRIEAGVIEPQARPFALQPLLNKIENELAPQADAKSLTYRSRETDVVVDSDPALVDLILRNFVSNAIRYTEEGGVLVGCRRRGDQAMIEVWDTGIGIAPAHQQEVFREFHQLGNPERDRRNGLGLGLSIAYGLARTLGHKVSLASVPGRGSVFRLIAPLSAEAAPDEIAAFAPADAARFTSTARIRVLVIDDDEAVRLGMCDLLRDWGFDCDAAETIEEAMVRIRTHPPAVVISDYRLRGAHTGAEAIVALRTVLGEDLPALLVTGDTAPERLREARASGVPLLHKPVAPNELYRGLLAVLDGGGERIGAVS